MLWLWLLASSHAMNHTERWAGYNVIDASPDLRRSVDALLRLEVWRFEMTHDTVHGRVHYGVLGREAEDVIGTLYNESVTKLEAVPGAASLTRRVVDQSVLFSHGLAALQQLAREGRSTTLKCSKLRERVDTIGISLQPLEAQVLETDWKTVKQLEPVLALEFEKSKVVATRLEAVHRRKERRSQLTTLESTLKNATLSAAHALALAREQYETELWAAAQHAYQHAAERSAVTVELERRTTVLAKLADDLITARERETLRTATAIETARESELRKAEAERANEDVARRAIREAGIERRQTMREAIAAIANAIAKGVSEMNRDRLQRLVTSFACIIAAFFISRESAILARTLAAAYLTRPSLVREFVRGSRRRVKDEAFDDIVLSESTLQRFRSTAAALRGARALGAPLRHILLYGPPGTGKTTVARRLARASGLDWAVMSGGDAGPLGSRAATELHKLFGWAKRSSTRGLLLFVDEAEAALSDRGRQLSEAAVSALNAFLYHTSDPSYSLVLVLATNRPTDLDKAVLDRIDDVLQLPLPDDHQRLQLLHLYFRKTFAPPKRNFLSSCFSRSRMPVATIKIDVDTELLALVPKTRGFSGREIEKLIGSVQGVLFSHHCLVLDKPLWDNALHWKLHEIKPKKGL